MPRGGWAAWTTASRRVRRRTRSTRPSATSAACGPVRRLALRALRVQGAALRSRVHGCAERGSGSTTNESASSTATSSCAKSRSCTAGASSTRRPPTCNDALELGLRLRNADLQAEAQQALGRVLIDRGSAREGLEQLDEAMLLAVEGRLGPYSTGKVYCSLISACEQVGDYRRAAEWTEATSRWTEGPSPHGLLPWRLPRAPRLGAAVAR